MRVKATIWIILLPTLCIWCYNNPVNCQTPVVQCYGDSFTYGNGANFFENYPTKLHQLLNLPTDNEGIGGQTSTEVTNRLIADSVNKNNPYIYWAGYNNIIDVDTILADAHRAINSRGHNRYLVISILNNFSRSQGTYAHGLTIQANLKLEHDFPLNYLNLRDSMVHYKSGDHYWDSVSIQDDVPNKYLMWDSVHCNAAGYNFAAQKIAQRQATLFNTLGIRQLQIRTRIRVPNGYFIYEIYTQVGQPLKAFTSATKFTKQEIFSNYPLGLYALGINGVYEWYYKR